MRQPAFVRGAQRLAAGLLCIGTLIGSSPAGADQPLSVSATVRVDQPGPTIHRHVFGQFAEFVGRVVHDGIWVGPQSSIPNTRGFRNDVIAALKELRVPIVRWPGGCYADIYNWRDGIGDPSKRPVRIAGLWGGMLENNAMGTHEFFDFVELIGAEAYVNGNVGSGSPREMADWVEYMTSDRATTLAEERRRNGRQEPFKVASFGIGNETWGCGGNMRAEYAADLHNRYQTFIHTPPYPDALNLDPPPPGTLIVASGSHLDDYEFTRVMLKRSAQHMDALSLHYYTFPTGKFGKFGPGLGFVEADWAATLAQASRIEELVAKHSAVMDEFDPKQRVGLFVDEWGTWYDATPGASFAWQQNTMRDAVVAAIHLNTFIRHAKRVRMTSVAQLANVLQSMVLTEGPKMVLTPTYHVFRMYVPFQDATFLPAQVSESQYVQGSVQLRAVDVVAARSTKGDVHVALYNLDPNRPARVEVALPGVKARGVEGQVLSAARMDAHNDFERPNTVVPRKLTGRVAGGSIVFELPPKAVAVARIVQ